MIANPFATRHLSRLLYQLVPAALVATVGVLMLSNLAKVADTPQVAPVEAEWRGVHDIYLVFTGGGFNVKSIKFTTDVRKADARIFGTSYAQAKSVNEAGRTLMNVRNGAWARYDGIDFGEVHISTASLR